MHILYGMADIVGCVRRDNSVGFRANVIKLITKKLNETKNYDRYFKSGLEVGKISKPIKGKNKYNIYKIDKITYRPLEQIQQQLKYQLTSKNRLKAIDEYVKKSIAENNIKIKKVN